MHKVLKSWVLNELESFEKDWYNSKKNQSLQFNYWIHQDDHKHDIYVGVIVIATSSASYDEWLCRKKELTQLLKILSGRFYHNVYGVFGKHSGTGLTSEIKMDTPKPFSRNLESRVSWLKHNWDPYEFYQTYADYDPNEPTANMYQLLNEQLKKLLQPQGTYTKSLREPSLIQEKVFDSSWPVQNLFKEEKVLLGVQYYSQLWRTHLWFKNGASMMVQHLPPQHFFFEHYETEILPIQGTFRKKFVQRIGDHTSWFISETSGLVTHRKADFITDAVLIPRYNKKIASLAKVHKLMLAD